MNSIAQQELPLLDQTLNIRHELLETLTDADLTFKIEGNPTLGELLKESLDTEHQYADSFSKDTHDWTLTVTDASATSVQSLKEGFSNTEQAFKESFSGLSEEEVQSKIIDRGAFQVPVRVQFHIYREAFLIYCAKITVYLKAMNKPLTPQLKTWVG